MTSKIIKRWVCGRRFESDDIVLLEATFKETEKQLSLIEDDATGANRRRASSALGYGSRFHKNDPNLHETREGAIAHRIKQLEESHANLLRKAERVLSDIEKVKAMR